MADSNFFKNIGQITLTEIAKISGAKIHTGNGEDLFFDVQPLQSAGSTDVSFIENKLYVSAFEQSEAGACLLKSKYIDRAPKHMALLVTPDPYQAFARVAQAFYPCSFYDHAPKPEIHDRALVDASAILGAGCRVDAGAVIDAHVKIGTGCCIGANSFIGQGVILGDDCHVGPNVTIQYAVIGQSCIFHSGARIGQDGFGFAPGKIHIKVPQLGIVRMGDGVDIGANACIDRGSGPDTVIGSGTKIDNMVQIGHNVEIGKGCLIAALSGISGSTKLGDYVMLGGATSIAGHLTIGDGVRLAGRSGVMRDVEPGETMVGSPAFPAKDYWRQVAALKRLSKPKKGA